MRGRILDPLSSGGKRPPPWSSGGEAGLFAPSDGWSLCRALKLRRGNPKEDLVLTTQGFKPSWAADWPEGQPLLAPRRDKPLYQVEITPNFENHFLLGWARAEEVGRPLRQVADEAYYAWEGWCTPPWDPAPELRPRRCH